MTIECKKYQEGLVPDSKLFIRILTDPELQNCFKEDKPIMKNWAKTRRKRRQTKQEKMSTLSFKIIKLKF